MQSSTIFSLAPKIPESTIHPPKNKHTIISFFFFKFTAKLAFSSIFFFSRQQEAPSFDSSTVINGNIAATALKLE